MKQPSEYFKETKTAQKPHRLKGYIKEFIDSDENIFNSYSFEFKSNSVNVKIFTGTGTSSKVTKNYRDFDTEALRKAVENAGYKIILYRALAEKKKSKRFEPLRLGVQIKGAGPDYE